MVNVCLMLAHVELGKPNSNVWKLLDNKLQENTNDKISAVVKLKSVLHNILILREIFNTNRAIIPYTHVVGK